jgi:putative oxidoreductase
MRDVGLLVLRVGIGIMFVIHGYPKIAGGTQMWEGLGKAMGVLGVNFAPVFWGFMAALAEFGGGICLALGIAFRIACSLMAFTMLVAAAMHLSKGDGFNGASHALELLILFVSLLLVGAGRFSVADKLKVPFLK